MEKIWSVSRFVDSYETLNTRRTYKTSLKAFFKSVYPKAKDLDKSSIQYLNEVKEGRDPREDILNFKKFLFGKAPTTIALRLSSIKRYLLFNSVEIPVIFMENINGKSPEPVSDEYLPTREDIAKIVEFMPIQAKTLTLVLASSGMRIGEALSLTNSQIDFDSTPTKINLRASQTKTKRKRITFITAETTEQLKEWLIYQPKFVEINTRTSTKKQLIFPFSPQNYYGIWKLAIEKAGLLNRDEDTGRMTLRPHNLRKFFRTRGNWTNTDIAEALMGHSGGIKAVYARYDQAEDKLREEYLRVESSLTVSEYGASASQQIAETRKEIVVSQEKADKALDKILDLEVQNRRLERIVEQMAFELGKISADVDSLTEFLSIEQREVYERRDSSNPSREG